MSGSVVYVDRSEIVEGKLEELKAALRELAALVEAEEPGLVSYQVFLDEDERHVSVLHVHRDADSLARHAAVAGPSFASFVGLVELSRIDLYGDVGPELVERMRDKARLLGTGTVEVHPFHAGFARL
ncbi:putative quinol monooxygenase [Georgenia daeguensis]|uniref:ABM domain-containing protein n=1 Tax=Georgenia daeguensis TaxID=908355 RepID=A0ABP8ES96_9MICO